MDPEVKVRVRGMYAPEDVPECVYLDDEHDSVKRNADGLAEAASSEEQLVSIGRIDDGEYVKRSGDLLVGSNPHILSRVSTATDYTVQATDQIVEVSNTSAPRNITLPSAPAVVDRIIIIKDTSGGAGTNNITVIGTIDGAANKVISTNYGSLRVYSDNSGFYTI
jgi:hypothetical protein